MMAFMFIVNASIVPAYAQTTTTTASPAPAAVSTGATISGVVRDSNGGPLQNATVTLQGPQSATTHTDANGQYTFTDVQPGLYQINFSHVGYTPSSVTDYSVLPGGTQSADMSLLATNNSSLITIGRVTVSAGRLGSFNTTALSEQRVSQVVFSEQGQHQLMQVLDEVPGFETAHESANSNPASPGNQSLPNIRGSLTQETLAQIDGHNIARSASQGYRLQYLNSALYQAVEVVKGPGATIPDINYDIMGAVNFRSLDPTSQPRGYVDYSTDNFGGQAADISLTGTSKNGKLGYALVYALYGAHGEPQNTPINFDIQQYSQVGGYFVMSPTITGPANTKVPGTPANPPKFATDSLYLSGLPVSSFLDERAELAKIRYNLSSATTVTASYFGTHGQTDENGNHFWQDPTDFDPSSISGATASAGYPTGGIFANGVANGQQIFIDDNYVPPYQIRKQDEPVYELDLRTAVKNDSLLVRGFGTDTNNHATNGVECPADIPPNANGEQPCDDDSWTVNGPIYGSFQTCLVNGASQQVTNAAACTAIGGVTTTETFNGTDEPVTLGTIPGMYYACDNGPGSTAGLTGTTPNHGRYTLNPVYPAGTTATTNSCTPGSKGYVGTEGERNGGTGAVGDGYFASNSDDDLRGGSLEYDHNAGPNVYTLYLQSNKTDSYSGNASYFDDPNNTGSTEYPGTSYAAESAMLRAILHVSSKIDTTLAGYFNHYYFHTSPDNGVTWNNTDFTHLDERVGLTFRPNTASSIRFAVGSSIAPPFAGAYTNGETPFGPNNYSTLSCSGGGGTATNSYCTLSLPATNLKAETAFGYDLGGSFHVIDTATVLDVDTYYEDLYNQFFNGASSESCAIVCPAAYAAYPLILSKEQNVSNARYKGVELSLHRDPAVGFGYIVQGNLEQGCPYNVSPVLYGNPVNGGANLAAVPCGVSNYIPPGDGTGVNSDSVTGIARNATPYAGGYGELAYHTLSGGVVAFGEEYYGNNNTYNIPPFFVAHATLAFPVYGKSNLLQFTGYNIFNADSNPFVTQEEGIPEPLINGQYGLTNAFGIGPAKYTVDFKHFFGNH
ncbi:MAG TPA: TonB-dependent receptor [Candidatus Acidoferrales bacterium]|nr:TonB-dependent receptor [Candidatus Acidoferrales bacterium]